MLDAGEIPDLLLSIFYSTLQRVAPVSCRDKEERRKEGNTYRSVPAYEGCQGLVCLMLAMCSGHL
eukprot:scaffold48885_cov12-Tisochrysis_lutea.AAC.1